MSNKDAATEKGKIVSVIDVTPTWANLYPFDSGLIVEARVRNNTSKTN